MKDKREIVVKTFKNINSKEKAYILGLLWSDGYVRHQGIGQGKQNAVAIEVIYDDGIEFLPVFERIGEWNTYERIREGRKKILAIYMHNRLLAEYLFSIGFNKKSGGSPQKVLDTIPEKYHKHFFLGIFDGDGCFYINKKYGSYQAGITSTYDQDWEYIENLFKKLNIKYSIQRLIRKNGNKHSTIRITNKGDVKKFGGYLYKGKFIVLKRKYKKFLMY